LKVLPTKLFLLAALVVHVIAAWFSLGWQHPDEHYQLLEFARYLLGKFPSDQLPWEFGAGMRPTFQVFFAAGLIKTAAFFGVSDPFDVVFLLRLITGIASTLVLYYWHKQLDFRNKALSDLHLYLSFFTWALVYTHVRFSSETWSGMFLVLALAVRWNNRRIIQNFVAGMLMGLAFITRFQTGFFLAGYCFYILFKEENPFRTLCQMAMGFLVILSFGIVLDGFFYGYFVFTPWNYLDQNIFKNVAASFGTEPWYWYIQQAFEKLIPPFSLFILGGFVWLAGQKKYQAAGWSCLAFIIAHSLVGHKEWRFLFPLAFYVPLAVTGFWFWLKELNSSYLVSKTLRYIGTLFVVVNAVLLFLICSQPAYELVNAYRFLYRNAPNPSYLLSEKENPYCSGNNLAGFFVNPNFVHMPLKSLPFIQSLKDGRDIFVFTDSHKELLFVQQQNAVLLYSTFPDWMNHLNVNHWLDRSNWYRIYQIHPKNHWDPSAIKPE
jgi:GPI mannosyltransferase 3